MFLRYLALSFILISASSFAARSRKPQSTPAPVQKPSAGAKEYEAMKGLLGAWEGTAVLNGKQEHVSVMYQLISGGNAIIERQMPNTPAESVTIYYKEGKNLVMTHYCAFGNQPHMKLKKSDGTSMSFELTKPDGLNSRNDSHEHAVTLTMTAPNALKQEWVNYAKGKKVGVTEIQLTRK